MTENKIDQLVRDANLSIKNYICNISIEVTKYILEKNLFSEEKSDLVYKSIKDLNSVLKN